MLIDATIWSLAGREPRRQRTAEGQSSTHKLSSVTSCVETTKDEPERQSRQSYGPEKKRAIVGFGRFFSSVQFLDNEEGTAGRF